LHHFKTKKDKTITNAYLIIKETTSSEETTKGCSYYSRQKVKDVIYKITRTAHHRTYVAKR